VSRRAGKARQRAARARALFWLPSLLAGVAVAAALATSAGILLYNSRGLTQAGAVLVAVSAISLAAGIWMGSADQEDAVPSAARGWMGFLVALLAGAAFAGLWEFMNGFGGTWAAQGLGLALTAALPSYFAGGVWGRMGGFAESLGLEFAILSDVEGTVSKKYDVLNDEMVSNRTTFVIGKDGFIKYIECGSSALEPAGAAEACSLL